jgi:hypothetical protein
VPQADRDPFFHFARHALRPRSEIGQSRTQHDRLDPGSIRLLRLFEQRVRMDVQTRGCGGRAHRRGDGILLRLQSLLDQRPCVDTLRAGALFAQPDFIAESLAQKHRRLHGERIAHRKRRVGRQLEALTPDIDAAGTIDEPDRHARPCADRLDFSLDEGAGLECTRDRVARYIAPAERRDAVA